MILKILALYIIILLPSALSVSAGFTQDAKQEESIDDSKGRRDPIIPLITRTE